MLRKRTTLRSKTNRKNGEQVNLEKLGLGEDYQSQLFILTYLFAYKTA